MTPTQTMITPTRDDDDDNYDNDDDEREDDAPFSP